ncbi:CBS domain-containing protein [Halopenitus salinus]|uniref:CBS domain-containing protein n=1 Tax=Halopenitus salinus TaxID=1198295 RepID=A0ABD5UU87_9EURY
MATTDPILVADVMSTPLETIPEHATLREAATRMRDSDINALFVPGVSAGIVTTTDVVEAVADGSDPDEVTVGEAMTAPVERITTAEELTQAAAMMTNFGIKHLPVVDGDGDYVGMVSTTDLATQFD